MLRRYDGIGHGDSPYADFTPDSASYRRTVVRVEGRFDFDISMTRSDHSFKNKMASTSQKHRNFVSEPMGKKSVTELAGVGEVLGKRLENQGFNKASGVLGQFLVMEKNKESFQDWMKDKCGANTKQSGDCYKCLTDWCDEFL